LNRGLLDKSIREVWPMTVIISGGLLTLEILFARVLPTFYQNLSETVFQVEFIRQAIAAFLGTEAAAVIGPAAMSAMAWVHPIVLTLVWVQAISVCTRVPAGEVDRGTIDILLSLPLTRLSVYRTESAVWLASGLVVIAAGLCGNVFGGWSIETNLVGTVGRRAWVSANLYALYVAVGGIAFLASCMCNGRGRAVGITLAFLIASFLLNFLAAFNETFKRFSFLSLMDYYRPLFILQGDARPIRHIAILVVVGAICWAAGAVIFSRRDVRTV
jgi:ABC-type transport system involved in multi-copper enzyme maturation permease subunit